jgi:predicted transposase/invertase (TIGR01784 family)
MVRPEMKAKYVNPFTDFGFKKIFGEEASKPLLQDFLNALLPPHAQISQLSFKNAEQMGRTEGDRRAIFDIYCESANGEKFIVELQKAKQNFFKDRTVYYSTFPIQEQAERGEWNYQLQAVYCVGILDFTFHDYPDEADEGEVLHVVKLKNQQNRVFYDKLTYIYLEMPNFQKSEAELDGRMDQWLFFLKHLEDFQEIPKIFGDVEVFQQAFAKAALAKMPPEEIAIYEQSLKVYRDLKGVMDTARGDGLAEGLAEGLAQGLAQGMAKGMAAGEELGIKKGLALALENLLTSGMPEAEARKLLGIAN